MKTIKIAIVVSILLASKSMAMSDRDENLLLGLIGGSIIYELLDNDMHNTNIFKVYHAKEPRYYPAKKVVYIKKPSKYHKKRKYIKCSMHNVKHYKRRHNVYIRNRGHYNHSYK